MNEFTAKKLGEVVAFGRAGKDTLEKGFEGLRKLFTEVKIEDLKKSKDEYIQAIEGMGQEFGLSKIIKEKSDSTFEKLLSMRSLYVKESWDNTIELCEWLGFFEGAAVVHWTLIKGLADGGGNKKLEEIADRAIIFHEEILKTASLALYNIGKEKSQ